MIDKVAFTVGPFSIHWYAICILTGVAIAVYLAIKEGARKHITSDDITDFILLAFPIAIIGARLYYVIFEWGYYSKHPTEIIAIWNGGLAIYGGLIAGAIVLYYFCYYRMIKPLDFMDIAVPGVMIAQSIGRWGNFVNQEAYGKAVKSLPYLPKWIKDQMFIDGSYRIPTFLYESLWNLLGFVLIMSLRHRKGLFKQGEVTFAYLIWYGCGRFVIEGMRTDSLMFMGLRVSQWLSALLVVGGIGLIIYRRRLKTIPSY